MSPFITIDSDNYVAHGIERLVFPGGELHVKIPRFDSDVLLWLKLRTWDDVGIAALLMDAIERQGKEQNRKLFSFIPYFPGARQDRSDGMQAQTLHVMKTLLLNSFPSHVLTFDAHSGALWNDGRILRNIMPSDLSLKTQDEPVAGIIAPDVGAVERAKKFRNRFYPEAEVICCTKKRDPHSGALSGYYMTPLAKPGHYIIVDDICDGGGTFNLLAEAFMEDPYGYTSTLELFVSHGIFSRGLRAIHQKIHKITTTDSFFQQERKGAGQQLTVIPLIQHVEGEIRARFYNAV